MSKQKWEVIGKVATIDGETRVVEDVEGSDCLTDAAAAMGAAEEAWAIVLAFMLACINSMTMPARELLAYRIHAGRPSLSKDSVNAYVSGFIRWVKAGRLPSSWGVMGNPARDANPPAKTSNAGRKAGSKSGARTVKTTTKEAAPVDHTSAAGFPVILKFLVANATKVGIGETKEGKRVFLSAMGADSIKNLLSECLARWGQEVADFKTKNKAPQA